MGTAILVTEILFAVLISSFLSRFLPKISTPLIQIAFGIIWYFTPSLQNVQFEPDMFMLLFIVPLFYLEARNIDRKALSKDIGLSLSLAVGLVLVTMAISGVALHEIWPAIPMMAAVAMGAVISPTDAVSVAQLGGVVKLTPRQQSVLQSESLLNDPVSLVGFQTMLVALATGKFSPVSFSSQVLASFVLGTLIGAAVGLLFDRMVLMLRKHNLEDVTTRMLMESFLPFGVYLISEHVGISGLLAVVACGVVITFPRKGVGGDVARVNLVSNSVWHFVDFTLNGTVFVLLGIQLPIAMRAIWEDPRVNLWAMIGLVLLLTVLTLLLRFVWCAATLRLAKDTVTGLRRKMTPERWHSAVVMTFGGPKGAISLAMAFTLPYSIDAGASVPVRNILLFIVSGYIVLSIVLSNVMLPKLSPKPEDTSNEEWSRRDVEMLRRTIAKIVDADTAETHAAVTQVLKGYYDRIERVETNINSATSPKEANELRVRTLKWERDWLRDAIESREKVLNPDEETRLQLQGAQYLLEHIDGVLERLDPAANGRGHGLGFRIAKLRRRFMPVIRRFWEGIAQRTPGLEAERTRAIRAVQVPLYSDVMEKLQDLLLSHAYDVELVAELLIEYRRGLNQILDTSMSAAQMADASALEAARADAMRMEMDTIREMLESKEITREDAKLMRANVHLMQAEVALS
ncbi:cation:proton antiporter [Bifidobacterium vespertilionis]|uniref:cation:proton antiporter n=1 Tax=Bifidobacterium vespertilionis TaxID=2562524 RepID=UPI001BDD2DA6|nr:sodium:proton antiporter [Bifidobacterium vespertilionis]MBT1178718.1 sodium:proton antiporter [Bifidobacterium vespertilionis]